MFEKKRKSMPYANSGFTLIETIVSIGLISLVLAVLVSTVASSLRLSGTGNQRYIASKIAQEGMELFQSKRNNNVICIENNATTPCNAIPDALYLNPLGGEKDWRYSLYERTVGNKELPPMAPWRPNSYEIDGNNTASLLASASLADFNATHYLCQDTVSNRFTYCGTPIKGNFTREIRVTPDSVTAGGGWVWLPLRVEVIVSWDSRAGGSRQSISVEKHLFGTQP
jgi:prepilin-type N-terminal cleavage/methylation domain-containing protein